VAQSEGPEFKLQLHNDQGSILQEDINLDMHMYKD
jgi:hypothetical protein